MAIDVYVNGEQYRLPCAKAEVRGRALVREVITPSGINGSFIVYVAERPGEIEVTGLHPNIEGYIAPDGSFIPSMEQIYNWKDPLKELYLSIHDCLYPVWLNDVQFYSRQYNWGNCVAREYRLLFKWM